jgi:hypothetical protein
MLVLQFDFDRLDKIRMAEGKAGIKLPDYLTDNDKILRLVNWGLGHAYKDLEKYQLRGIPACLTQANGKGNCPLPPSTTDLGQAKLDIQFGHAELGVAFQGAGGRTSVELKEVSPICGLATSVLANTCLGSLFNSLAQVALPVRRAIARDLLSIDGVEVVAKSLQTSTGASGVALKAEVAIARKGAADFNVEASGSLSVTPVCGSHSIALALHAALDKLSSDARLPEWMLDGAARHSINTLLHQKSPIVIPLKPKKLQKLDKEISLCEITDALLKTSATDQVASAIARSLLPLEINAASAMAMAQPGAKGRAASTRQLAAEVADLTLVLRELQVQKGAGSKHLVDVEVELRKAKEAEPMTTQAVLSVTAKADCAGGHDQVSLHPTLERLKSSKLPSWLLGGTVLNIVNQMLSSSATGACVAGNCQPGSVAEH